MGYNFMRHQKYLMNANVVEKRIHQNFLTKEVYVMNATKNPLMKWPHLYIENQNITPNITGQKPTILHNHLLDTFMKGREENVLTREKSYNSAMRTNITKLH